MAQWRTAGVEGEWVRCLSRTDDSQTAHAFLQAVPPCEVKGIDCHSLYINAIAVHEAIFVVRVEVRVCFVFGRNVLVVPVVVRFCVRVYWTQLRKEIVSACWTSAVAALDPFREVFLTEQMATTADSCDA